MRIISGKLKGKSIDYVKSNVTRPLKDSVKENIFNIIAHSNLININLNNSHVLDLYSGIGSFGLECLSRGCEQVVFVEKDKNSAKILLKNLQTLFINNKALVMAEDVLFYLSRKKNTRFDIFFLDPPFANNSFLEDLKLIREKKIFNKNHLIIIHRERKSHDEFSKIINPIIIRNYSRSKIIFAKFLD